MKRKIRDLIPAYIASIIDITITITHQAPAYWDGDLSKANEGNPIGGTLMEQDVSGIFIISGLWLLIIGPLGYYLPAKLSRIFLLFVLIAHSYGASTWLSSHYGFWFAMLLILFNSAIYILVEDINRKVSSKKVIA
ncbi:MAG: hypothetical protein ACQETL_19465 [Bacteroidota bacterium]